MYLKRVYQTVMRDREEQNTRKRDRTPAEGGFIDMLQKMIEDVPTYYILQYCAICKCIYTPWEYPPHTHETYTIYVEPYVAHWININSKDGAFPCVLSIDNKYPTLQQIKDGYKKSVIST